MKKLCFFLILMVVTAAGSALAAYATPGDDSSGTKIKDLLTGQETGGNTTAAGETASGLDVSSVIAGKDTAETEQFLITITRPQASTEIVYEGRYTVSASVEANDVVVIHLARFNSETDSYEAFPNVDGESRWEIASFFFSKDVNLKKNENKFKIVAYEKSKESQLKNEDLQVTYFTISHLDDKEIVNSTRTALEKKLKDIFGDIFKVN